MASSQLENYIATHRKRSGLSQQDVAWILRAGDGSEISRYEMNRRLPFQQRSQDLLLTVSLPWHLFPPLTATPRLLSPVSFGPVFGFWVKKEEGISRSRHTEAQMIAALKQMEAGRPTVDVAREMGVATPRLYQWNAKYGGMDVSQAQKARQLRDENMERCGMNI